MIALLWACAWPSPEPLPPPEPPQPPVPAGPLEEEGWTCVVIPQREVVLSSEADGVLAEAGAPVSAPVQRGQLLGVVESRALSAEVGAARASQRLAQATLEEAALLVQHAQRQREDEEQLAASGASATHSRERARLELEQALVAQRRAQAALEQRQAELERLQAQQEGSRLLAPFDGTVAAWLRTPGERVSKGERLVRVSSVDVLSVRFAVPVAQELAPGQTVTVIAEPDGRSVPARVRQVAPDLELASQMRFVEADLQEAGLVAGQACRVLRGCGAPVPGETELMRAGALVLLGELHGTREIPLLAGALACRAAHRGLRVQLGLELPSADAHALQSFLQGEPAPLLAAPRWTSAEQDGRTSEAMLVLLEQLRALRAQGLQVEPFFFDPGPHPDWNVRDQHMAEAVLARARSDPQALVLVLTGDLHARTVPGLPWDSQALPMGVHLRQARPDTVSLLVRHGGGSAWICKPECAAAQVGGEPEPGRGLSRWPTDARGHDGAYAVDVITASPPAVTGN
jgi:RND family efflux transporter MFP subunit